LENVEKEFRLEYFDILEKRENLDYHPRMTKTHVHCLCTFAAASLSDWACSLSEVALPSAPGCPSGIWIHPDIPKSLKKNSFFLFFSPGNLLGPRSGRTKE
jgi:hypothetical protein